jgi:hypothetical protein
MEKDVRLAGKAERTVEAYTGAVRRLVQRTGKPLGEIEEDDVREYLLDLVEEKVVRGTFSINLCGIRFFWRAHRAPILLFPAPTRKGLKHSLATNAGPIHRSSLQGAFRRAPDKAGIAKDRKSSTERGTGAWHPAIRPTNRCVPAHPSQ